MKNLNTKMKNKITYHQLAVQKNISYFAYVPENATQLLVLVHGISRNAEEIISSFQANAENKNIALIAPLFTADYAKDYQRLGRNGRGPRSDYQLFSILKDFEANFCTKINRFHLFGYSAGAQFAHRFAFAYPNLVKKVAIAAAGWYTLPTSALPFPRGTRLRRQLYGINFEPKHYLRTKYRVFIGAKDTKRDEALNKNPKIDLTQGKTRMQRAKNWIDLMHLEMQKNAIANNIKLEKLANAAHDFSECVQQAKIQDKVMQWLLAEQQ